MGRVVWAGVDAARLRQIVAQVAGGRFADFLCGRRAKSIFLHNLLQVDVAVGTIVGTEPAADTPVLNNDFKGIPPANGADRAAHHEERVFALAAGGCDEEMVEAQAVAQETCDSIVGVGAGADTLVAAGAFFEIEDEQALRVHQSLGEIAVEGQVALGVALLGEVFGRALAGDLLDAAAHVGEAIQHLMEVFGGYLDQLDVIERGAGRGALSRHLVSLEREQSISPK